MKKARIPVCIFLSVIIVASLLSGCGGSNNAAATSAQSQTGGGTQATTVSQGTNFTSSVLELSFGTTQATETPLTPQQDVVTDELTKDTGVKWKSIEGLNGMDYNQRINLAISSGEFPDVFQIGNTEAQKFLDSGLVWPIKIEDLKKYAPEAAKRIDPSTWFCLQDAKDNTVIKGLPSMMNMSEYDKTNFPTFPAASGDWLDGRQDYVVFSVRDDILKSIFPTAKTFNELSDLFKTQKNLTFADVGIQGLQTADDFLNFLRKVKALGLKQKGKPVIPFCMGTTFLAEPGVAGLGQLDGFLGGIWYNIPWNPNENQVQFQYALPEYKSMLKKWNGAAKEGLFDINAIILKPEQLKEKILRGEYAVVLSNNYFDANASLQEMNDACDKNKLGFHYTPVYLPILKTHNNPGWFVSAPGASSWFVLNKKTVKESDIPKILNFYNFFLTEKGAELISWGPESAGLWTVGADGKRHFKDKALEDDAVNWAPQAGTVKNAAYYGLITGGPQTGSNLEYRYLSFYNNSMSPYSPRALAWPFPSTGSLNELYTAATALDSKTHQWQLDPAFINPPDFVMSDKQKAAANELAPVSQDYIQTYYPKIIFSQSDADFEKYYKAVIDLFNKDDALNIQNEMNNTNIRNNIAKYPALKPLDWPVK